MHLTKQVRELASAALVLSVSVTSMACMNTAAESPARPDTVNQKVLITELRQAMQVDLRQRQASKFFGHGKTQDEIMLVNAIDMVYQGDLKGALTLLHHVEAVSPGKYATASNLGTTYELLGDNINALKWINEGIARHPESHHGTEWLHAAILEAKIAATKSDSGNLIQNIIKLPADIHEDSEIRIGSKTFWLPSVSAALFYQLRERLEFVKPTDPYVAELLFIYARIEGSIGTRENALGLLQLAKEYGFSDQARFVHLQEKWEWLLLIERLKRWAVSIPVIAGVAMVIIWSFLADEAFTV